MRKVIFSLVLSLLIMFSNFVYAQSNYLTFGSLGCGVMLDFDSKSSKVHKDFIGTWSLGYVSGRNYSQGNSKKIGTGGGTIGEYQKALYYSILNYCRKNPLKSTGHAMEHIYNNELD